MGAETDFSRPPRSPETEILGHEHRNWKADMMSALGESVSFGRFLSEPLEWGKWSAFAHNRYLEEAARQSRPGSVAQKKAFFEAHYAKKRKSEDDADDGDEDAGRDLGLDEADGAAASSADSSCMTDEPGWEKARGVDSDAAGRGGVVADGPVEASEELEAIPDGVGSSCRVDGADERCHGEDDVPVGEARDGLQVLEKQEDASQDFCDANFVAVDAAEKQPLKESSIVNQCVTDSAKKRRLPMSSLLQKPTKFSSPPSGKKGMSSSAKKRSPLHSAKENSSPPPCTDSNKQAAASVPQKRSTLAPLHMSMNFTRCETGNAASSSRNLSSTIAVRISQLESVSRSVKDTQPEVNQFRPPRKAFFKAVPEIASRTSQLEEQRSSHVTRVKEKLFGSTSSSVHQKNNVTKEKVGKANNESELKESRQSFCFKARALPNFCRKNKQAKDSSQQSAQGITNLPNSDHVLNDVSYAHQISKGGSKDKQICCFPLRRLC